jgi:hypothetical protein
MVEPVKNVPATLSTAATNILRATQGSGLGPLMKFKKSKFFIGDQELPIGRKFIAYAEDWRKDWVKFRGGEVVDQRLGKVADGFESPERQELDDQDQATWEKGNDGKPRDPWVAQDYLPLEDAETGERFLFVTSSAGGRIALDKLCARFARNIDKGLPTIKLGVADFPTKAYGPIPRPDFPIVAWERDVGTVEVIPPKAADVLDDAIPF